MESRRVFFVAQLNHRLCVPVEAIILRPHGFLGTAMVAIVRFVQNHAAAPWPVWEPKKLLQEMTIQTDQGPSTT